MNHLMANKDMMTTVVTITLFIAALSSIALITSVGIGDSVDVIMNDPDNTTSDDLAAFGTNASDGYSFIDRGVMAGAWLVALGPFGLGAVSVTTGNTKLTRDIIRFTIPFVGILSALGAADTIGDVISRDFDWDLASDSAAALALFQTSTAIAGISSLFKGRF